MVSVAVFDAYVFGPLKRHLRRTQLKNDEKVLKNVEQYSRLK